MASKALQVLLGHLVLERLKETEETLDSQDFPARRAERENLDSLEALDHLVVQASKASEVRPASVEVLVSKDSQGTLVTKAEEDPKDYEGLLGVRESRVSPCQYHRETTSGPLEIWVIPGKMDCLVGWENLVPRVYQDVPAERVVLVLLVNLAGQELPVFLGLSGILGLLVFPDLMENKVFLVQLAVQVFPVVSGAAPASASRW